MRTKKRFGQHFLHDPAVLDRIVAAFDPRPGQTIVEIGPGRGALTRPLLARAGRLHAIEIDRDLAAQLPALAQGSDTLIVHTADALEFDWSQIEGARLRVIGNLPYNISTPMLFRLIDIAERIDDMLFMLQKEVADRISASPGSKEYGRLSVMVQWRCAVERLFSVGPGAFNPPPQVESTLIRLLPRRPPYRLNDPQRFSHIVKAAFGQRRKTLRNSLRGLVTIESLTAAGIDPQRRAETLSFQEFAQLAETAV